MKIEQFREKTVAFIRRVGPYGAKNKEIMEQLKAWAQTNKLVDKDNMILAFIHDNPQTTLPQNCRYDVCVVLPPNWKQNKENEVTFKTTKEAVGNYAVFTVTHTPLAMQQAWGEIFRELEENSYLLDEKKPIVERYQQEFVENHLCEICVPVQVKGKE